MRRAVPFLAVPLLAACGETNEQPRLTQKQFAARADRVCIQSDRRVFRIGSLSTDPTGWKKTADAAQKGIDEMAKLRPPAAQQERFDRMLASARKLRDAISDVEKALAKKDFGKARAAQQRATGLDTSIKHQAAGLRLPFCQQLLTNWPA